MFPTSTTFPGLTLREKIKDRVGMKETGECSLFTEYYEDDYYEDEYYEEEYKSTN